MTAAPAPSPAPGRRRIHPAWIVAGVAFLALVGAAGFRSAPSALIVPLQTEFGWSTSALSLAVSVNILLFGLTANGSAAENQHRVVIQVDQNDPAVMNLALNNATNVVEYYRAKNQSVDVDIVTYGPGLNMLREDTSPVKDRIKHIKDLAFPGKIQFSACNNTKKGMEKKEGHPIAIVPEATIVPSGVVHVMELQEQGWSYVRP